MVNVIKTKLVFYSYWIVDITFNMFQIIFVINLKYNFL